MPRPRATPVPSHDLLTDSPTARAPAANPDERRTHSLGEGHPLPAQPVRLQREAEKPGCSPMTSHPAPSRFPQKPDLPQTHPKTRVRTRPHHSPKSLPKGNLRATARDLASLRRARLRTLNNPFLSHSKPILPVRPARTAGQTLRTAPPKSTLRLLEPHRVQGEFATLGPGPRPGSSHPARQLG